MGYYRGDYYRGDYYQGGLLSSLGSAIGKFGGAIGRAAPGLAKFIPGVGTAISIGSALVPRRYGGGGGGGGTMVKDPGLGGLISRILPGGQTGYHRRRRMNVANPKALRRAIRRAHGFAKLARTVLTFPISKPPKGRPLFKGARRRR